MMLRSSLAAWEIFRIHHYTNAVEDTARYSGPAAGKYVTKTLDGWRAYGRWSGPLHSEC